MASIRAAKLLLHIRPAGVAYETTLDVLVEPVVQCGNLCKLRVSEICWASEQYTMQEAGTGA